MLPVPLLDPPLCSKVLSRDLLIYASIILITIGLVRMYLKASRT